MSLIVEDFSRYKVLLFAKEPQLGRVKTRMQRVLSDLEAMHLHIALTEHIARCLTAWQLCPVQINYWFVADESCRSPVFLSSLAKRSNFELNAQVEGNLGDKMAAAVCNNLQQGCQGVLLLGADCPFLSKELLQKLIRALRDGHEAAIIPAHDGGYVALALRCYSAEVFAGIEWGGDRVLEQTMRNFERLNWRCLSLPSQADIDRPEDLALLQDLENIDLQAYSHMFECIRPG